MRSLVFASAALLVAAACGDDTDTDTTPPPPGFTTSGSGGAATGTSASTTGAGAGPASCFTTQNGLLVIEAESLPITDSWTVGTDEPGFTGDGYIFWNGDSMNGNPGAGVIEVTLRIDSAGRYRFQWHNRIGMGTNATEHNDTWVQFPDAADYYGLSVDGGQESRRYPKPQCDDADFVSGIEALAEVTSVECAEGSTQGGWMKVYSSGATDWRWSTRTSDNDAHDIFVEFSAPGDYMLQLSARGDFHLIDRIVVHEEGLDDGVATDLSAPETRCP